MKKCLLIAPLDTHATIGRIAALSFTQFELHLIDVSYIPPKFQLDIYPFNQIASYVWLNPSLGHGSKINNLVESLRSLRLIPQSRRMKKKLAFEINRIQPSIVVTYYGPIGIYFAGLVKGINSKIPVVSILNLIPSSLDYSNNILNGFRKILNPELNNYRNILKKIDFIICASSLMKNYVSLKYKIDTSIMRVIPDFFPETMNFKIVAENSDNKSSGVIFLGAPERWGATIDDLDDQFLDIAKSGVSIHAGKISNHVISLGNAFCYNYFKDEDVFSGCLSTFAHQFQASIITYGISKRHQRFKSTLPTRFFSALSAGLPIAVRAGLFDAVEEYVERYAIGFKYSNAAQLKERLSDKAEMDIFKENANTHSKNYFAEAQSEEFRSIFESLFLNIKRGF